MDEKRVREVLTSEMRFQHQRLVEAKRKEREVKAVLDRLYDRTFWDTRHTPDEIRQRSDAQEVAQRESSVIRSERYARESALESLRAVSDVIRARRIGRLW